MNWLIPNLRHKSQHWFWGPIHRQRHLYKLAAMAALLINIFSFAVSLFSMIVYDRILPNSAIESLLALSAGVLIILVIDYFTRMVRSTYIDIASQEIDREVAKNIYTNVVLAQPNAGGARDGATASVVRDFDVLKDFLGAATIVTFVDIPFSLLFIVVIYFIAGPIVIVPIIGIFIFCLMGYFSYLKMKNFSEKTVTQGQNKQAILVESLSGRETIRALNLGKIFLGKWQDAVTNQSEQQMQNKLISSDSSNKVNTVSQALQVLLLAIAVYLSLDGRVAMGGVVAASILSSKALAPFSQVVSLLTRLSHAIQSYKNLDKYQQDGDQGTQEQRKSSQFKVDHQQSAIEFKSVSYGYPGAKTLVLDDVSFKIEPGHRVAVLGRSGAGKTTLIRLILGLVQPQSGTIMFGGIDIRQLDEDDLRSTFGVALQETFLFSGSLAENITLKDEQIDSEDITRACQLTGLNEFISKLPEGFATQVAERGAQFSGGQKQLIAMTRAVYGSKTHYIFDEPTANLDPATEQVLIQNLEKGLAGKTLFYVTHRPNPLQMASHVMILEQSKIVAFGPRDDVLRALKASAQNAQEGVPS